MKNLVSPVLFLVLLLVTCQAYAQRTAQRSVQSSRSRSVQRAPAAVRAPAVRAPAAVVRPPRVITPPRVVRPPVVVRPRPVIVAPRSRVVVRPGVGALRAPIGGYSSSSSITQNYSTGPAAVAAPQSYTQSDLDALQAENQALREENAYLKGQLNK